MALPSIQKSRIGRANALVLENEMIRAVIVPGMGGRILSLICKRTETEFAWRSPNFSVKGSDGELENVSGFFDCVPTTDPCTFRGKQLPLGGEISSKPWTVSKIDRTRNHVTVHMEAKCKMYPFLLRKEVSLAKKKSRLVLSYELRNLSADELEYHYSSHNTLGVTPYHRIILPHEVSKLRLGYTGRLGKMGDYVSWPETIDIKGNRVDISKIAGPCERSMENLYTDKTKEHWCAAVNEAKQEAIGFTWDGNVLPYLLVCTNNGGWRDYYFAALEPVTGRPDNLEVSVDQWKENASLKPKERIVWNQRIILADNVRHIEKIENDEIINA